MNKITIALIGILAIMFFTGNVYAGTITQAGGAGTDVTVPDGNGTSAALTFTPSPGILMGGVSTAVDFTVVAGNLRAEDNAVGYCMIDGVPTIYQSALTLTATSTNADLFSAAPTAGTQPTGYTERQ